MKSSKDVWEEQASSRAYQEWSKVRDELLMKRKNFANRHKLNPDILGDFSDKSIVFMQFLYENEKDSDLDDYEPVQTISIQTFVLVLPYIASPKTLKTMDMTAKTQASRRIKDRISSARFSGIDDRYIAAMYSKFLKSYLK